MASAFGSSVLPQNNIKKSFKIKKKTLKTAELVFVNEKISIGSLQTNNAYIFLYINRPCIANIYIKGNYIFITKSYFRYNFAHFFCQ